MTPLKPPLNTSCVQQGVFTLDSQNLLATWCVWVLEIAHLKICHPFKVCTVKFHHSMTNLVLRKDSNNCYIESLGFLLLHNSYLSWEMTQNFQLPQPSPSPKSNFPKPARLSGLLFLLLLLIIVTNYLHAEFQGYCRVHLVCFTSDRDHSSSILSLKTVVFFYPSFTVVYGGGLIYFLLLH